MKNSVSMGFKRSINLNLKEIDEPFQGVVEASQKYLRQKRSCSLPFSFNITKRSLNKIQRPSINLEKYNQMLHPNQNNRQFTQPNNSYLKINKQINNKQKLEINEKNDNKMKMDLRLTLKTKEIYKETNIQILRMLRQKLSQIYWIDLETDFLEVFQTIQQTFKHYLKQSILYDIFLLICDCFLRKYEIQSRQIRQKIIQNELKITDSEMKLKIMKLNITNTNRKYQQLVEQISKVKCKNVASQLVSFGVNTENVTILIAQATQTYPEGVQNKKTQTQHEDFMEKIPIDKLLYLQKLKNYQKKERELINVLCFLKTQGVNIQKAYRIIIQNKIKNKSEESQYQELQLGLSKKNKYNHRIKISNNFQNDADHSIISEAEAISFNYQDKELKAQYYEQKYQFKQSKEIKPSLKKNLKLNLRKVCRSYTEQPYHQSYGKTI